MASMWHYRLFGEDFGPVPEVTLQELIQVGTLGESDEVRSATTSSWTTVSLAFGNRGLGGNSSATLTAVSDAESADDALDWYCLVSGQELGPLAFNDLLRFAENGELNADDEVRFGATGRWRKVGSLGRLMASLPYQVVEQTPKPVNRSKTKPQTPTITQVVSQPTPSPATAPVPVAPSYLPAAHELSWYAWMSGKEYGPVSLVQLSDWQKRGQLNATGMVKYGQMGTWTPPTIIAQTLAQFTIEPTPVPVAPPTVAVAPPAPKPVAPPQAAPAATRAPVAPAPKPAVPKPPETKPAPQPVADVQPPPPREAPKPVYSSPPPPVSMPSRPPVPAWQPPKAAPKKSTSSGGGGIDFGFLAPLAETKNLAIIGGCLLAVALFFVFPMLTSGFGRDKVYLEQLQAILKEYRELREKKAASNEWTAFGEKSKKTAAEIVKVVEPQAGRAAPQKQYLLWNSKFRLNEMLQKAQEPHVAAEYEFENNLFEAAKIMKVPMDPPKPPPPPPGSKPQKVNPTIDIGT